MLVCGGRDGYTISWNLSRGLTGWRKCDLGSGDGRGGRCPVDFGGAIMV